MVGEYGCAVTFVYCGFQLFRQVMTIENVIAQHQRTAIVTNKLFANDKGLCQSVRAWLNFILKV